MDVFNEAKVAAIKGAYQRGLRTDNLGAQPATWVLAGLDHMQRSGGTILDFNVQKADEAQVTQVVPQPKP